MRGKAKEQLNVLKQVRAAVWAASDADSLLRSVARCVVPDLAEYCVVDAWDPAQRRLSRLEIAHADASLRETLRSARERYAPGPESRVQQILASGEPLLVENVSDAHRARLEPGDLDFTRRPVASYMAVPVGGRRGETAVLTLVAASTPLRFDEERARVPDGGRVVVRDRPRLARGREPERVAGRPEEREPRAPGQARRPRVIASITAPGRRNRREGATSPHRFSPAP